MGGGGGVGDEGFAVAEIVGDGDQAQAVHSGEGRLFAAGQCEGHQRAAAGHLALGERILRVVGPAGIADFCDLGAAGEEIRHDCRRFCGGIDAQGQGFQALEQQPGVERRDRGAGVADEGLQHVFHPFLGPQHGAAEHAALAVNMLGAGVDDDIGAELQGFLLERGGEDVIDHHQRAGGVGEVADGLDVHEVQHRVGRAFQQHHGGFGGEGLGPGVEIGAIDKHRLHTVTRQQGGDDPVAGAEQGAGGDEAIAGFQMAEQGGMHGSHAGGGGATGLGAFEQGEATFEHGHGGVAEAGILVMLHLPLERGFGLLGAVIDEAGGEKERLGSLAVSGALDSAMHEQAGRAERGGERMGRHERGPSERTGR